MHGGSVTPDVKPAPETVMHSCSLSPPVLCTFFMAASFCQHLLRCTRYGKGCFITVPQPVAKILTHMATLPWLLKQFLNKTNPGINHLRCHNSGTFHRQILWLPLTAVYSVEAYSFPLSIQKAIIGASLSEPHTSVTALRMRVCMLACLDRPLTENFK